MDGAIALEIVREVGLARLGGFDGCVCSSCKVQGVHIDISCHKSSGHIEGISPGFFGTVVRVYSSHMDVEILDLVAIAKEVVSQLKSNGGAIMVRFMDARDDHDQSCVYCGKHRTDAAGYLCDECLGKHSVFGDGMLVDYYDHRKYDFIVEPENV